MEWIKQRVWQLGLAILLVLLGAWLMYAGGVDPVSLVLLWAGLIAVIIAMLIPLLPKLSPSDQEEEG